MYARQHLCVFICVCACAFSPCCASNAKTRPRLMAKQFIERIFENYGNNTTMSYEGFEHFLVHLGLGNIQLNDHSVRDHDRKSGFNTNFHTDHSHEIQLTFVNKDDDIKAESHHHHHAHDNLANVNLSKTTPDYVTKTEPAEKENQGLPGMEEWKRKIEKILEKHSRRDKRRACYSPNELLSVFNIKPDAPITGRQFHQLCPSILYQLDNDACMSSRYVINYVNIIEDTTTKNVFSTSRPTVQNSNPDAQTDEKHNASMTLDMIRSENPLKVWGFGMLAILVISAVGLAGVAVVPIIQKKFYHQFLQFLVAMAIGALTGDALLHLLPHALTSEHDEDSTDENTHDDTESICKGLVALGGIFVFFLAERIMNIIATVRKHRKEANNNSDVKKRLKTSEKSSRKNIEKIGSKLSSQNDDVPKIIVASKNASGSNKHDDDDENKHHNHDDFQRYDHDHGHSHEHGHSHGHGTPNSASSVASMVIMGDGLHNFSDGLAIGAAFASGLAVGLSTTLAVFCHELPHELGDFAMLLKTGMKVRHAIFYNVFSSVLAFIGGAIGIVVGSDDTASQYILLLTAGIFIYIALADMLPEMEISMKIPVKQQIIALLLQTCGILLGMSFMLVIAMYEDEIVLSIN